MMRMVLGVTLTMGLIVCGAQAATAGGALIKTTAPLSDSSEESVKLAVVSAIDKAVRGASAMGFAWVQLQDARISEHEVVVQVLATDEEPADATPAPDADESDGDHPGPPVPGAGPSGRVGI